MRRLCLERESGIALLLALAVAVGVRFAPNDMTLADSAGCLLTSQALVRDGTLALDAYPGLANPDTYRFEAHDGHVYYALGFGTSVLCVPAVWVAHRLGLDMAGRGDRTMQRFLAAGVVGGIFFLCWLIARLWLPSIWAGGFALSAVLGTSLSSTLGTALWNMGFETLALLAAVRLVARREVNGTPLPAFRLGLVLGLAVFCRPTALLATGVVGAYVLVASPRDIGKYLAGVGLWIVALGGISQGVFGLWIPPYYRTVGQEPLWRTDIVLQGLLFSPGRGIFVFSPVFLAFLVWLPVRGFRVAHRRLAFGGAVWFGLHVLLMARFDHWWGGHCYGPRLLTDAVPALVPIGVLVAADVRRTARPAIRRPLVGLLIVLATVGVAVHTVRGLYSPESLRWNQQPDIDPHVRYVFDWRYPQPLETPRRRLDRRIDADLPVLEPLVAGTWARPGGSGPVRLYGRSKPETDGDGGVNLFTDGSPAHIAFVPADSPNGMLTFGVRLAIGRATWVRVSWNGVEIGEAGPGDGSMKEFAWSVGEAAVSATRHGGHSYGRAAFVPEALQVSCGGKIAHEIEFTRLAGPETGADGAGVRLGGVRWTEPR